MSKAQACRPRQTSNQDHGRLIPPGELFDRVLPGGLFIDAHLPFEERVERAWKRLLARFEEDEHERLREALVEVIESDRHGVMPAKEVKRA